MTWTAFHRRGEVLRTVVSEVDRRRDGVLPMEVPGVAETFGDELDLIAALSLRWHLRLSGNVERALAGQPLDVEGAVVRAWRDTGEQLPGIRRVLDRYTADPVDEQMRRALTIARNKELAGLAIAAGLAGVDGAGAVTAGRALLARGSHAEAPSPTSRVAADPAATTVDEPGSPSLVDRIRAALVA